MNPRSPLALLGGMTPAYFMKRFWQKRPLLIRQALPGADRLITRQALFELAAQDHVSSRLVKRSGAHWSLQQGPFARRALPPLRQPNWTLLVQGVDLHSDPVHQLLQGFRFLPDARLDDVMISHASAGGGVGPHFDSYDVFLLQAQGRRRWQIGRQQDKSLRAGLPLRILQRFVAEEEYLLAPGDMLYLPPGYAHDGVAMEECRTCSIGFRARGQRELGIELLQRMAESGLELGQGALYRDPGQTATAYPARLPPQLLAFAGAAVRRAAQGSTALAQALGEYLSEPGPDVWFDPQRLPSGYHRVRLDRRTRMLYHRHHVFVNGETCPATGADARLLRRLADRRELDAAALSEAGPRLRTLLDSWLEAGWIHGQ